MDKVIEINLEGWKTPEPSEALHIGRKNVVTGMNGNRMEATIMVLAYNRLEKTKECIRSILENTNDVSYKLLLIDNGSTDQGETLKYFQSIEYENKLIFHFHKNLGPQTPLKFIYEKIEGKYFVTVANDIVVTARWLTNMIKIAESDSKIGMVNPISSNVSNLQRKELQFRTYEEMQREAERINISDPKKWHERLRLITLGALYTCECLFAVGWPLGDVGFFHDFVDDDITFRVRRNGYKAILANDTWIHHNHSYEFNDVDDREDYQKSLEIGRENFKEKYFGVDAWDDVNNYISNILPCIKKPKEKLPAILGIDVKCGTPILEIKNKLREFSIFNSECSAFTQESKYVIDLKTVCNETVVCDREEFLKNYYMAGQYHYIYIGRHINHYHEPISVLLDALSLLKPEGQMFVTLKNSFDILSFLHMLGFSDIFDQDFCLNYPPTAFEHEVRSMGYKIQCVGQYRKVFSLDETSQAWLNQTLKNVAQGEPNKVIERLMTDYWVYEIGKSR